MRVLGAFPLLLALILFAHVANVSAQAPTPTYRIIVNPNNPMTSVERTFLAEAFLKKIASWPSGEALRPVDLVPSSPTRRSFSEEILHRSVADVKGYWQQRIFSGRDVPPPEFDTNEDVVKYVLKYEGAIGYVSGDAQIEGARVVTVK
jgi:ABC-type phosphate transport system substrate-binding protein